MTTRHAMLNGKLEPTGTLRVSPLSEGFQFGYGVFTTLRLIGGRPAMLADHHHRLSEQAGALDLGPISALGTLWARCLELAQAEGMTDGAARVTLFRDVDGVGELIQLRPRPYGPDEFRRGFALKRTPAESGAALAGLKTIAYLRYLLAKRAATAAGFDEALLVDGSGRVLEGATSNIFCVRNGLLVTPPAADGLLPGIVRGAILGGRCGVTAEERSLVWEELIGADEVFVTNSLMGVMPVRGLDGQSLAAVPGPVTRRVARAFGELERASLE